MTVKIYFKLFFIVCSDCEVFPKNHAAPFSKVLTFYRSEPFTLEAYYNNVKEIPCPDASIGTETFLLSSYKFIMFSGFRKTCF